MAKPFTNLYHVLHDAALNIEKESRMLPDNRLDFITNIDPEFINMMTGARADFIKMDAELRKLSANMMAGKDGVNRCISLARTNLEQACMYTIKALCLMGEIKPEFDEVSNGD